MNTAIADIEVRPDTGTTAKSIRVLHVNSGNLYGGVESILVTLARFRDLCPSMETHFALCYEGRLSRELQASGAPVHFLGGVRFSRPWTVLRARRQLESLLDREQFDVVICHMPWNLAVFSPAVRGKNVRLAFWAHSFHDGKNWIERLARRTSPDFAIANSRFTQGSLGNLFPTVKSEVIYPPVPLVQATDASKWRREVREELGVGDEEVVIAQVSRFDKCKGHQIHLEALACLKSNPSWFCVFVGGAQTQEEADYRRSLGNLADANGLQRRVKFLGERTDIARLLAGADITASQTRHLIHSAYLSSRLCGPVFRS